MVSSSPAILVLEDGRVFRGDAFGAIGETFGEAVFATGMSGYQETLTDPSYYRQVVIATAPHIGNTGWNDEDDESSRIWVAGYAVRDPSPRPSNWRSSRTLESELVSQQIVVLASQLSPFAAQQERQQCVLDRILECGITCRAGPTSPQF